MKLTKIKNHIDCLVQEGRLPKISVNLTKLPGFIALLGLQENDILILLQQLPMLSNPLLTGEAWLDALKQAIQNYCMVENFSVAADPVRIEHNTSRVQRRTDSLARLLAVDESLTPCVSVAIHAGKFYVAYNDPSSVENEGKTQALILQKMALLREFLYQLIEVSLEGKVSPISTLTEMQIKNLAGLYAKKIYKCCAVPCLLPAPTERASNRRNLAQHLQQALLKTASSCLHVVTEEHEQCADRVARIMALIQSDIIFVNPLLRLPTYANLHAEQVMREYLLPLRKTLKPGEKIALGTSKLCCVACDNILHRDADWISYRGTHGVLFPNVMDMRTRSIFEGSPTKWSGNFCAQDSDSEVDITGLQAGFFRFFSKSVSSNETLSLTPNSPFGLSGGSMDD